MKIFSLSNIIAMFTANQTQSYTRTLMLYEKDKEWWPNFEGAIHSMVFSSFSFQKKDLPDGGLT